MDDTLRAAVAKKLDTSTFEEQFIKSFKKAFGIKPTIEKAGEGQVKAHGEYWSLDGHGWLLWCNGTKYVIAEPELFADAVGEEE